MTGERRRIRSKGEFRAKNLRTWRLILLSAILSVLAIFFSVFFTPIFSYKVDSRFVLSCEGETPVVKLDPPLQASHYFVSCGVSYSNRTVSFPGRIGIYLISPQGELVWSSFSYADGSTSLHRLYFVIDPVHGSSMNGDTNGSYTLSFTGSETLVPHLNSISVYRRVFPPFEIKLFYLLSRYLGLGHSAFPLWMSRPDGWVLSLIGVSITAPLFFILFAWLLKKGTLHSRIAGTNFKALIKCLLFIFLMISSVYFFKDLSGLQKSAAVTIRNNEDSIEMFSENLPYASVNNFFKWCDLNIRKSSDVVMFMRGNSQFLQARAAYFLYPRKVAFVDLDESSYGDAARLLYDEGYKAAISFEEIDKIIPDLRTIDSYRAGSGFIYEVLDAN